MQTPNSSEQQGSLPAASCNACIDKLDALTVQGNEQSDSIDTLEQRIEWLEHLADIADRRLYNLEFKTGTSY